MQAKEVNFSGKVVKDLKIIKLIGQGNWADVYLAQHTVSHQKFAVKVTPQNKLEQVPKLKQLIKAQIAILKQCKSPNVVRLFNNFVHQDHQFIVLEYCSGFELGDILLREKKLDEPTAVNYLKQILNGFKGLHEVGAMHRDFKAENVMLHQGLCKIVDLGFGKQLQGGELATTKLGSNLTMAPQVMQGLSYDFKADIWSIGVVFYQMLFGKFPFQARGPMAILQKARNQDYSLQSDEVSEQSKDFIAKCFKFDPEERINWVDIYKHPLIAEQSHEVNMGLKDSKINVEENINFYLKKVKSDVSYPSDLGYSESNSQIRAKQQEKEKPNKQRQEEEIIQNQPSQGLLNDVKEDQIKKEQIPYKPFPTQSSIRMLQMARNQQLSEQYLKAERLKVANAVKDIKYIYMQQLDNIQFISRYTIGAMQETARLGCTINHTPIICLLVKVAYKRLECLNDGINLQRNPFNVDYNSLKYFIEDQQFHEILKTHLKEFKNMFQHYRGFLSDELKDLRLLEATRDITNAASLPPQLLDEYLTSHAQMIVKSQFRGNQDIQCRLLKLSFCLSKYKKFKQDNFSKKRILKSLNNFNYARAYQDQQRRPIFNQIRRQIYAPPPPRPIFPFGIFQYGLRGIRFPW